MLSHPGKDLTNFLTFRFDLDGVAHAALQWEFISLSHRVSFPRHYNDGTRRKNVTGGRSCISLVTTMREQHKGIELMDEHDWLAEQFEANRGHLQAGAHRMLRSLSHAGDAVQEARLPLHRPDPRRRHDLSRGPDPV